MIDAEDHEALETWAQKFGGTALLGFICTLLICGKFLHHAFQQRGLVFGYFIVPPALISGLLGLVWCSVMAKFDEQMATSLGHGLEAIRANLINFVFAALSLGMTCTRTTSQHKSCRGMFTSLLHEGMPMVIYNQILIWGQSTCCLIAVLLLNTCGALIPNVFAAMVPLGVEAGDDVFVSPINHEDWSSTILEEAESLGLVAISITGIIMMSIRPWLAAKGYAFAQSNLTQEPVIFSFDSGHAEAFERAPKRRETLSKTMSFTGFPDKGDDLQNLSDCGGDEREASTKNYASLGAHISIIALSVFLSFGLSLSSRLAEIELQLNGRILSGVPLFKLAMFCGLFSMQLMLCRPRFQALRFKRDWFMRLCGLMLDLLLISALSMSYPKPQIMGQTYYLICCIFVLICLCWNLGCFVMVAPRLFPNYWFTRALTLSGDAMGHAYTGLLFARTLDPAMESPVPAAYAYKLMLFFVPTSGVKNSIVLNLVASHGASIALLVCLCIVAAWVLIFETYFRNRFVSKEKTTSRKRRISDNAKDGETDAVPHMQALSFDDDDDDDGVGRTAALSLEDVSIRGKGGKDRNSQSDTEMAGHVSSVRKQVAGHGTAPAIPPDIAHGFDKKMNVLTSEQSSIATAEQIATVAAWLPDNRRSRSWSLKYSLRRDGANLETLLALSMQRDRHGMPSHSSCVILIEDSWGYTFGGFVAHALENKASYYGNGESFVFSLQPTAAVHRWTGVNNFFVISNLNNFAMGGGGDGFAFQLDDELDTGVSNQSGTFDNRQLSSSEFFKCLNVELWVLDSVGFSV